MPIGFRIYTCRKMPDPAVVGGFSKLAAAPVADCMGRLSAMHPDVRRFSPRGAVLLGAALTVKARSGDNLMIHKALDMAVPGDVVVVANEGDRSHSSMGEVMFAHAVFRGIAGIVTDGAIRDVDSLEELPLLVYATGSTPAGPYKDGPGEINVPVSCGGQVVYPGDIIMGDSDGVIVIPAGDAKALLEQATAFTVADSAKSRAAREGKSDRSWIDKSLQAKGCEVIEAVWDSGL